MKTNTQNEVLKQSRQALKEGFLAVFDGYQPQGETLDIIDWVFFPLGKKEEAFHLRWNLADESQWSPKMLKHLASALYGDADGIYDDPDCILSEEQYEADYRPTKSEWEDLWLASYGETVEAFLDPSLWDARIQSYFGGDTEGVFDKMEAFRGRQNLWSGLCLSEAFKSMKLLRLKVHLESDIEEAVGYMVAKINEKCFQWEANPADLFQDFAEDLEVFLRSIQDFVLNHTVFQDGWILRK